MTNGVDRAAGRLFQHVRAGTTGLAAGLARRALVEAPRPRSVAALRSAPWLAVATVCFGAFMGQLDASIVTLAFPAMGARFHTGLAGVEWVSLAYLITVIALLAGVGRLADMVGRKQLYLHGFALFTVASVLCGLAPNLPALVGFRVVQAVGAALLQANSVALVTTSVPAERMRAALGVQAAAQALGLAIGPTVGGLLVDGLGWQWVFFVNLPVGVLGLIAGRFLLPRTRDRAPVAPFDWAGLLLLAAASTGVLLVLSSVSGLALPGWATIALLLASVAAGVGFVAVQRRSGAPLVDLRLLRRPAVSGGLLGAMGGYLLLFGPLVLIPVLLAGSPGAALRAGLVSTALPVGFGLAASLGGRLLPANWGSGRMCRTGAVICLLALGGLVVVPPAAPWLAGGLALLGVGLGLFTPANNALVLAGVPGDRRGLGGGLVNMARGLGTAFGVAGVTLVLHLAGPAAGPSTRASLAFGMLAVAAVGVVAIAAWVGRRPTARTPLPQSNRPARRQGTSPHPARASAHR